MKALQYLHGRGLAHTDVQPDAVLFASDGSVKLCAPHSCLLTPVCGLCVSVCLCVFVYVCLTCVAAVSEVKVGGAEAAKADVEKAKNEQGPNREN